MTDLCDPPVLPISASIGRTPVSPFHDSPGLERITLAGGGFAGFARRGRWAVFPCEPVVGDGSIVEATLELLDVVRCRGLRPVFAGVSDPTVLCGEGFVKVLSAFDALVDLRRFSLGGPRRSSLRHSVAAAGRAGLSVRPWEPEVDDEVASVSTSWLATKRGGEMGFTLGRVCDWSETVGEGRVAVDRAGRAVAVATWRAYDGDRGRVLDVMRRRPDAPNPAMDMLLVACLSEFARAGVIEASLSAVPVQLGRAAERVYPTESLSRYKDKFDPQWSPLWLVAPSLTSVPFAVRAVINAFCEGGVRRVIRSNARAS